MVLPGHGGFGLLPLDFADGILKFGDVDGMGFFANSTAAAALYKQGMHPVSVRCAARVGRAEDARPHHDRRSKS